LGLQGNSLGGLKSSFFPGLLLNHSTGKPGAEVDLKFIPQLTGKRIFWKGGLGSKVGNYLAIKQTGLGKKKARLGRQGGPKIIPRFYGRKPPCSLRRTFPRSIIKPLFRAALEKILAGKPPHFSGRFLQNVSRQKAPPKNGRPAPGEGPGKKPCLSKKGAVLFYD